MIDVTETGKSLLVLMDTSHRLSMVLVRAKPHKGYVTEGTELSSIVPKLGSRGMENLVTKVTDSAKMHPEVLNLYLYIFIYTFGSHRWIHSHPEKILDLNHQSKIILQGLLAAYSPSDFHKLS